MPDTDASTDTGDTTTDNTKTDEAKTTTKTEARSDKDADEVEKWRTLARKHEKRAKELEPLAAKLAELDEKQKTDEQRLVERAEKAEGQLPTLQAENLRLRVAIAKNLPADLVDRLRGDTQDELTADADKLLELVGDGKPPTPKPDRTQGAKGEAAEETDPAKLAAMVSRDSW